MNSFVPQSRDDKLLLQFPHLQVDEFRQNIAEWLEMMAAAYMKATDIPPEECQLVVQMLPSEHKMVYRFERRKENEQ